MWLVGNDKKNAVAGMTKGCMTWVRKSSTGMTEEDKI